MSYRLKKKLKSFRSEIQNGRRCRHLKNLFFASSPETKGQLELSSATSGKHLIVYGTQGFYANLRQQFSGRTSQMVYKLFS